MDRAGHDLFSNPRLSCDEDGGPRSTGDPRDLLSEPLEARRGADQAVLALLTSALREELVHHMVEREPDQENLSSFRPHDP